MNIQIGTVKINFHERHLIMENVSMDVDPSFLMNLVGREKITKSVNNVTHKTEKVTPAPVKITKPAKKVTVKKKKASVKKKIVKSAETNTQTKRPATEEEQQKINQVYQRRYSLKKKGELTDEAQKELDATLAEIEAKRMETYQIQN